MDTPTKQIDADSAQARKHEPSKAKLLIGYLFALACLIWVFHDVHPRELFSATRITNWWFLAFAVAFDVLTYVLQGIRWSLLLRPAGKLPIISAVRGIYVGLFTNEIVPLRLGELVRAFLVSRWLRTSIGAVVPSMVVERFVDGLWLLVGVSVAAVLVPLPKDLMLASKVLGVVVIVGLLGFTLLVLRKEKELEKSAVVTPPASRRGFEIATTIAMGLRQIGLSKSLYFAAIVSLGLLLCQGVAFWLIMLAFGLKLSLIAGAVVTVIVRLGTAIPNAPANVGSFQFFTVLGLGLFGVDKTNAAAFSIVSFAALTAPLWIIGFFALAGTGMSFASIRTQISNSRS